MLCTTTMNVVCDDSTMLPFIIILTFCCTIPTKNLHQLSCTPARRSKRVAAAAGNYPKLIVHRLRMGRTQSLRLIRTSWFVCCCCCCCRRRRCCWTFLHTRLPSLSATLVVPLLAHLFSTFLSRYFILLRLVCKFFLYFLFSFSIYLSSFSLSRSISLSFSIHLRADYIKYTYDRQLYNTYKRQHSCLMYGSGLLLYLVQFGSAYSCWYLCASCLLYRCVYAYVYSFVCMYVLLVWTYGMSTV